MSLVLPFTWVIVQYNLKHNFFAESYADVGICLLGLGCIHSCLILLRMPARIIVVLWLILIWPSFHLSLALDLLCRFVLFLGLMAICKKVKLGLINFVLVILCVMNGAQIIQRHFHAKRTAQHFVCEPTHKAPIALTGNIYFILCDAYAGREVLSRYYQFDNNAFYENLQKLGFNAQDGKVTYRPVNGFPTLKALNYFTNLGQLKVTELSPLQLHFTLKGSCLFAALKHCNYGAWGTNTRFAFLQNLGLKPMGPKHFYTALQLVYCCLRQNNCLEAWLKRCLNSQLYRQELAVFAYLQNEFVPSTTGKNFYYFHIDCPHAPFVFDERGGFNDDQVVKIWGENEVGPSAYSRETYRANYVRQLQTLNRQLLALMVSLIEKDPQATIILQGDHGTFMTNDQDENAAFMFAVRLSLPANHVHPANFFKEFIYGE